MPAKKKIKIDSGSEETDPEKVMPPADDKADEIAASEAVEDQENKTGAEKVKEMEEKLEAATQESKENYERLLRVSADFENYKKRVTREMEDFKKFANQSLIKDLLPVIDNLELALKSSAEDKKVAQNLIDGVDLTYREILKIFEKHCVAQIEALGQPFDPNFHEAVMREETDDHPENTVTNELQKGYRMHERLIRPSMVVVAMPKNQDNNQDDQTKD
jgi:molecular chaperone GrpE